MKTSCLYIYEQSNVDKKITDQPIFKALRVGAVGGKKNKKP